MAKLTYNGMNLQTPVISHYIKNGKQKWYAILPRFSGLSLWDFQKSKEYLHLSLEKRKILFNKICEAINNLHQKEILHDDIYAPNIMVDVKDELANLIDFGKAKILSGNSTIYINKELEKIVETVYNSLLKNYLPISLDFVFKEIFEYLEEKKLKNLDPDHFFMALTEYAKKELNLLKAAPNVFTVDELKKFSSNSAKIIEQNNMKLKILVETLYNCSNGNNSIKGIANYLKKKYIYITSR